MIMEDRGLWIGIAIVFSVVMLTMFYLTGGG